MENIDILNKQKCHHCGEDCEDLQIPYDNKVFCCQGCKMVYSVLSDHGMEAYYEYEKSPGSNQKNYKTKAFEYLDDPNIVRKLLLFSEGDINRISLHLPQIHCSSCLWLLENLNKINAGVLSSKVDFSAKKATVIYNNSNISLRELVELLAKIGYEPNLNFENLQDSKQLKIDRSLLFKLGLAGFSFGNIMLLSFPEYLGFEKASIHFFIGYINIILATPVLLYSGQEYLISAWKSIRVKQLNIDVPIAIGMITLYARSVVEILGHFGEGFLDSFAGFVFFLLIGKWFQEISYKSLDFNRNYKSYFPISAIYKEGTQWLSKTIDKIKEGDILLIRNEEIIPSDAMLLKGKARIDYSFVTGESDLISKESNEIVFAGGKQVGSNIEVRVIKSVDESYLTQLWNEEVFRKKENSSTTKLSGTISKYFTIVIIAIAFMTFIYWSQVDMKTAFNAFTAVLIVACPCALALAIPFTYGHVLRLLSGGGLFLKNVETIESLQDIDHIIFDKTGTITDSSMIQCSYEGKPLSENENQFIKSACMHSAHPLSKAIMNYIDARPLEIDFYEDLIGQGFIARQEGNTLRLGSSSFIFGTEAIKEKGVFVEINGRYKGQFTFKHAYRDGIIPILNGLKKSYSISVLSGDNESEKQSIIELMGKTDQLFFNQSPQDKLNHIRELQKHGSKVMMIGDGLNDAGALKQSDVGIVITQSNNNFSPACDGILSAEKFSYLLRYIQYVKKAKNLIYASFILAFMYNSIGLYFAIAGKLSPVIAAILMPLSSISVVVFGVLGSYLLYINYLKKN